MPASPLVNSPPATTSLAGSSHHLPLQLHLNRQKGKKDKSVKHRWKTQYWKNMCYVQLPPDWRGETAFLVRDGWLEPKWSNERQRTRQTGRARRAMSGASGSYRTGHSGTPCTAMKRTKNTAGSSIYTGSLCAGLGTLPALAPICFCPNIRKRWER